MAGPRPDDSYNPLQTVAPTGAPNNDYLSVRSTPDQFGAGIGKATQGLGQSIEGAAKAQTDINLQVQGLANEHAANAAEMQLAVQGGEVYNKFKSLEGLDATNARPQFIKDYLSTSDKIREELGNPAAQRAYDQIATRRMSFTIQDMNSYAAEQQKHAYRTGNTALAQLSINNASSYDVANNPKQLDFEKGNIIFQANAAYTAPVYGRYQSVPATTNKDGTLSFDTKTDQGKIAQADYDNYLDKQLGDMYSNAVKILATDPIKGNVKNAVDFLEANKTNMKPSTFASLSAQLHGPYQNELAREDVDNILSSAQHNYQNQSSGNDHGPVYATNLGNVTINGGAFANPTTPVDGATLAANNLRSDTYKGKTLAQIGQTWVGKNQSPDKIKEWVSNVVTGSGLAPDEVPDMSQPGVLHALLKGITLAEKSPDDRKAFDDNVIAQGVKNSLSGAQANLSQGRTQTLSGTAYQSEADYLGDNQADLIEQIRKQVEDRGGDSTAQDAAASRLVARINEKRSAQSAEIHSLSNQVFSKIIDTKNPITNISQLDNNPDPQTKQAWQRLQFLDPYKAGSVQRIVQANAEGKSKTYGTDFYSHYNDLLTGKVTDTAQLQDYFGGDKAPISNMGIKVLQSTMEDMQTPQGQAFRHSESAYLDRAKGMITGSTIFPGINPAVLGPKFDKYIMQIVPQIEAKRADMTKHGLDPSGMFNPDNKDYIGHSIVAPSQAELTKAMTSSMFSGQTAPPPGTPPPNTPIVPVTYNTLEDVGKAYASNKITKEQARAIVSQKFGGFAPKVPAPQ